MQATSTAAAADFVRTKTELDILSIPEIGYVEAYDYPEPFQWRGLTVDSFGRVFTVIRYGRWSWGVFPNWKGKPTYGYGLKRTLRRALKTE